MDLQIVVAVVFVLGIAGLALALRWWLGRRERALTRLLDSADALEDLLKRTRARTGALQHVVGRVPDDIGAVARASLDTEAQVQQGLRNVLEHRLWIARHGATASPAQLAAAQEALERARTTIASQLERLESVGADLADVTQAAVEQAAREPSTLRRGEEHGG